MAGFYPNILLEIAINSATLLELQCPQSKLSPELGGDFGAQENWPCNLLLYQNKFQGAFDKSTPFVQLLLACAELLYLSQYYG